MQYIILKDWCSFVIIEAKINGNKLLSLDKGSLEELGLSIEFQLPLMKIIKGLVCYLMNVMQVFEVKDLLLYRKSFHNLILRYNHNYLSKSIQHLTKPGQPQYNTSQPLLLVASKHNWVSILRHSYREMLMHAGVYIITISLMSGWCITIYSSYSYVHDINHYYKIMTYSQD